MFGVFVSVLQLVAIANAFIQSLREKFVVGSLGAIARAVLLVLGAIAALWIRSVRFPSSEVPPPAAAAAIALVATMLGPIISFGTLWMAHRRRRDVPAAQEERLGRPFVAWLPVALLDGAFVVINLLATVITRSD